MPNQDFKLNPSKMLTAIIFVLALLCCGIIISLAIHIAAKIALLCLTCAYTGWLFWTFSWLRSNNVITQLIYEKNHSWRLITKTQALEGARLNADSTFSNLASLLRFTIPGQKRAKSVVIFKDMLDKNHYRQLCIKARYF